MRVLITNLGLITPAGSQTYCFALAREFKRRLWNVTIYTPQTGPITFHFQHYAFVSQNPKLIKSVKYDLAIIHHKPCLETLKDIPCFRTFNSNGLSTIEHPTSHCHHYTAISEEIQNILAEKGYNAQVLRNGINCEQFSCTTPINPTLKTVLFLSNHKQKRQIISNACKLAGIRFMHTGLPDWVWNPQKYINQADLVISLGRGIYESMACERNVIIFDHFGADGFITPSDFTWMQKANCSGRIKRQDWNAQRLAQEFTRYDPALGPQLRKIILSQHNIQHVADHYIHTLNHWKKEQ